MGSRNPVIVPLSRLALLSALSMAWRPSARADAPPPLRPSASQAVAVRGTETVNVRDFGARGDVLSLALATDAPAGSRVLAFASTPPLRIGERVTGIDLPAGATVVGTSATGVSLSVPLSATEASGTLIDFCPHDDTPAFVAAQAALPGGGTVHVPGGRYYLAGAIPQIAGITYRLDAASIAYGSAGLPNFADQSQVQALAATAVSRQFASSMQENNEYLSSDAVPSGSHVSYQKNVQSIRLTDADPYTLWTDARGTAHTATHDLVGQFILAEMPPANRHGGLWDTNWVLGVDAGSQGGAILQEAQVINGRAAAVTELDDPDPVSGYDWIFDGTTRDLYGLLLQGNVAGGGPGLENGILFRRGAIRAAILANRTAAYAGADGRVTRHLDNFHVMADGSVFAQSLHVGGGDSDGTLAGEVLPAAGLSVDRTGALTAPTIASAGVLSAVGFSVTGNANGAIALGSRKTPLTPLIDFDSGPVSSCRVLGNVGSNLDFSCLNPATGSLVNDLILFPSGAAFQVPATFASIRVGAVPGVAGGAAIAGGLDVDTVTATGAMRAAGGIVTRQAVGRTMRVADCGATIRDGGGLPHTYTVPAGLPIGCRIDVLQEGAGAVRFAAGAGETMEAYGPASRTAGLHAHSQILVDTAATFNVHP